MVKQGFLNLPEAERRRVIDAALDEFARHDFFTASLNRIIRRAGISKGSLYHYFHNKEDLYLYLLEEVAARKKRFLAAALDRLDKPAAALGFFDTLEVQVRAGLEFARTDPRLLKIHENLESVHDPEFKARIRKRLGIQLEEHLGAMVDRAVAAGELRSDLGREFLLRLLGFFFLNFTQIFPEARRLAAVEPEQVEREIRQLLAFLKSGLQGREAPSTPKEGGNQ